MWAAAVLAVIYSCSCLVVLLALRLADLTWSMTSQNLHILFSPYSSLSALLVNFHTLLLFRRLPLFVRISCTQFHAVSELCCQAPKHPKKEDRDPPRCCVCASVKVEHLQTWRVCEYGLQASPENKVLSCKACKINVHENCYGVHVAKEAMKDWHCACCTVLFTITPLQLSELLCAYIGQSDWSVHLVWPRWRCNVAYSGWPVGPCTVCTMATRTWLFENHAASCD